MTHEDYPGNNVKTRNKTQVSELSNQNFYNAMKYKAIVRCF